MVVVGWWQGGEEAGVDEPEEEVRWGLWWWRGWVGPGVRVGRLLVVRVRVEVLVGGDKRSEPEEVLGVLGGSDGGGGGGGRGVVLAGEGGLWWWRCGRVLVVIVMAMMVGCWCWGCWRCCGDGVGGG